MARLGRKTRIGGKQREALWSIFAEVRAELVRQNYVTWPHTWDEVYRLVKARGRMAKNS